MDMINFNSKKQRFQLQKLLKELNQHDEFVILSDFQSFIGFNAYSGKMYAVLENLPKMKNEETLSIYADEDGEVYYMITDEDGEETSYSYGELLFEVNGRENYICEICGDWDYDGVGIATGENGIERRVCGDCDIDGMGYNGWGDKKKSEESEEEEQEGQRIYLFEFQGKTYFKSLDYDFIYDREKKEVIGKWSEELQKIILNDEED